MSVEVEIGAGDSLKIGVRSSNLLSNGQSATAADNGWFKVDNFRLKQIQRQVTDVKKPAQNGVAFRVVGAKGGLYIYSEAKEKTVAEIYSLLGRKLYSQTLQGSATYVPLLQGIYIVKIDGLSNKCCVY